MHGARQLETLQPTSEREHLLLFADDLHVRDPLTGEARSWLARFDRWSESTLIGPEVDQDRMLPGVNRVLTGVDFTGTKSVVLKLRKGTYRFVCDPHASFMHGSFRVA